MSTFCARALRQFTRTATTRRPDTPIHRIVCPHAVPPTPSTSMRAVSTARQVPRMCGRCRLSAQSTSSPRLPPTPPPCAARSPAARRFTQHSSHSSQTLYSLFPETLPDGPPPNGHFPIDRRSLRGEFLRLQSRFHPDLHPPSSKAQAAATSAALNNAYKTLSNPLLRAQYLLSLQGVDVANDETLKVEEPELLALVLEAHETIEGAACPADLHALSADNEERISQSEHVLETAFREHDLDRAKKEAVRLRYWVNVRDALSDWEEGKPAILQH
ncbi:hypothetical protein ED733_001077 [Metarhizium rileyi]|uniref:Co-chaperone HscB C-terminal oligomerisation domain-containing protein n=1 Tax=Metarhizium rileyi (strain RCEF 4871) TaxID=1649241 RepID=A0A5C6GKC0_METRR|nr:hypothetical protein ED733_001077 [Metarhizium rileyi]